MEHTDPDLTDAWRAVLENVQPNQRAWLSHCDPVTVHDDLAIIAVPDEFTRTQVEGRLRAELEGALSGGLRPGDPARHHHQPRRWPPTAHGADHAYDHAPHHGSAPTTGRHVD